jgi:hypothetical protein
VHSQRCGTPSAAAEAIAAVRRSTKHRPHHICHADILHTLARNNAAHKRETAAAGAGGVQLSSPLGADRDAPAAAAFTRALHDAGHTLNDDQLVVPYNGKQGQGYCYGKEGQVYHATTMRITLAPHSPIAIL